MIKNAVKTLTVFFVAVTIFIMTAVVMSADSSVLEFDADLYYGRQQLAKLNNGDALVKAYDALVSAARKGEQETVINTMFSVDDIVITTDEVNTVFSAYRYDNPGQFWVDRFQYTYYSNKQVRALVCHYLPELNTATAQKTFFSAADKFIKDSGVTSDMSEYEIAKILHDKVAKHVEYIETANSHNAYGALIEGKAVCEGYAELYQYLLYKMGIQSHIVTGDAGGPHAWNLVRIDGQYYQTDVTWDDQGDMTYYAYFNVTTAKMLESRVIDNNGYPIPTCTATEANYFAKNSDYAFTVNPSADSVANQLKTRGYARVYYDGNGSYTLNNFSSWLGNNRGYIESVLGKGTSYSMMALGREFIVKIPFTETESKGDVDGNGETGSDDAIYLLYSVLFGSDSFPLSLNCDFDKDGSVTSDDAIYLLYHVLFGAESYPI